MPATATKVLSIDAAKAQLDAARARLAELNDLRNQIREAEQAVYLAKAAVGKADAVNYLRVIVWAADGKKVPLQKQGTKVWWNQPRDGKGWRIVYHANESGFIDIMGDLSYRKKHDKCLADVSAISYGPKVIGVWYWANGKQHFLAMGGNHALREKFSLTDGETVIPIEAPKPTVGRES